DELRALSESDTAAECLAVSVKDKFGDYGLTGAMVFRDIGDVLVTDTFLLSCRALGRGVEHRMAARLGEIALERGLARIEIKFQRTQRNRPARLFLDWMGGPSLAAHTAAGIVYKPQVAATHPAVEPLALPAAPTPRRPDYVKIATRFRTPQDVLAQIEGRSF